ncbi:hypothetical protein TVAGG3_0279680 [Trichomonas vaginalis G3]|uniref:hypothetical protein n=1 Tax=Trichomonas vaginalis (strain ATCC PRA-98 / G3) TaxID=412133 RepID=UPI0021E5606E|nr:hypothetical protein TVAGG3_0279680 [Trichomonas vaginalis G3]KAI5526460.1 hypothetical protein TVAGG3_0279680 [Trichomonas vaginalis G3]
MTVEAKTFTNKSNGETFTKGTYNGIEVLRRDKDGYINVTNMCQQFRKDFRKLLENKSWEEYYKAFCEEYTNRRNSAGCFLYKIHAGIPDEIKQVRGTYVDPRLINYIAMWASPKYCIAVGKIMDSIDKKVHEKLDEEELEDTVENAKPLFEQEVRKMCEKQIEHEHEMCYGYKDSPYELDQWEQEDLKREFREYELAKIAFEAAEKKLKVWGRFVQKYCE